MDRKNFLLIFLVVLSKFQFLQCKSYYRAAVLEHVRFGDFSHTKQEILGENLKTYNIAAKTAAENGADIIVFPECGLYPPNKQNRSWVRNFAEEIPDPKKDFSNPCAQRDQYENRPILLELSCLAYQNGIYLVANMPDLQPCSNRGTCDAEEIHSCTVGDVDCPEDEVYIYNTNVVFDRQGTLIARYHKRHLYFEFDLNTPVHPEDVFFETEFGTFTTFICFDLVFKEAVEAVEKSKVINVAYPTYWFDTAPFFWASSYHQAWAMTNNVNLLSANVQYPATGTIGSGIYSAEKGALVYTNNPDWRSKILISNVPRVLENDNESLSNLNIKRFFIQEDSAIEMDEEDINFKQTKCSNGVPGPLDPSLTDYNCFQFPRSEFNSVKLENKEGTVTSCMNNFCCELSYEALSMEEDYFLEVYSGEFNSFNTFSYGFELCSLTRCESQDNKTCSYYYTNSNTVFQNLIIRGNFTTKYVYPSVIESGIRLTDKSQWNFDNHSQITYNNVNNALLSVGLLGRHYDKDKLINLEVP